MTTKDERIVVDGIASQLDYLRRLKEHEEAELGKSQMRLGHSVEAQEILQHLAQAVQQQAHAKISEVVSFCLSAVFDDPYVFKIVFERKRGKTEANLRFVRRKLDADPLTASGGGVVDVAAFALRVACLVLHRPRLSRVVVIDEGFRFVSAKYRANVRSMLEQLSEDLRVQIPTAIKHRSQIQLSRSSKDRLLVLQDVPKAGGH
jgi:hypothetical protein